MIIYRIGKLPCIYSELTWIRVHQKYSILDDNESFALNCKFQEIYNSERCLSTVKDGIGYLYIAIDIPEEIQLFNGNTKNMIEITEYYYRSYDVLFDLIGEPNKPCSCDISDTKLDCNNLNEIFDNSSCISLLKNTRTHYYDFVKNEDKIGISNEDILKIQKLEKQAIARFNLRNYSIIKKPSLKKTDKKI